MVNCRAESELPGISCSDESQSESGEDCWDRVDHMCSEFPDSSDSDEEHSRLCDLKAKLQEWAVSHKVTHSQLNGLLPILKEIDNTLPCTAKTLLKIPEDTCSIVTTLSRGDYMYLGVKHGLTRILASNTAQLQGTEIIELTFNIDGLPLFDSSTYSLWPVLCCVANIKPSLVFPVALYGGNAKPADLDFLSETINELLQLLNDGITANDTHFKCVLKFIVCDAPARALIKCSKQFSGYYGCDKCSQRGEYVGRMTFPDCDVPIRDDESFRNQSNAEHHTGISPFCKLPIDMIKCFPFDYMHQSCLGVMKRLLACWTGGDS